MDTPDAFERRVRAAEALRALNHAFVAADGDATTLDAVAAAADALVIRLEEQPRRDRLALMRAHPFEEDGSPFRAGARPGFEDRAVAGVANPTSVGLAARFEPDAAGASVVLRHAFEGAPGRAHGGVVAAVFDDVTGFVIGMLREPAFTGELTVRFVNPVPVHTELEFRSWLAGRDGRKLYIEADCRADETIVATCKAIYITVPREAFAAAPDPR